MKRKIFLLPIMAAVLVFCGGCTKMVALTEQEANTIALYSAQIVSKYSRAETPGLGVPEPAEISSQENSEETSDPPNQSDAEEEDTSKTTGENNEDTNEESEDENESEDAGSEEEGSEEDGSEESDSEQESYVSFSDAIGISGLSVEYADYEITNSVSEGSYFSLDATEGNKFVVLTLKVENTSSDDIPVNIFSMKPRFHINIDDGTRATAEVTLLMDDFNTIDRTFAPGENMTARLVFEVDEELEEELSSVTMDASINGETSKIKLL